MVTHLFPNFLTDEDAYHAAERYWVDIWERIASEGRMSFGWKQPWFTPLPASLSEGNPIFSAVSPILRRGIRIIQDTPIENGLEFVAYPDTFGGTIFDPRSIRELVISCALSDVAVKVAVEFLTPWIAGRDISFSDQKGEALRTSFVRSSSNRTSYDEYSIFAA